MFKKPPLKIRAPELYSQWDFEKNQDVDVETVNTSKHILVWWKCDRGHSWQEYINSRIYGSRRCPLCAKRLPHITSKTLSDDSAQIALDWDYDNNQGLSPDSVASKSGRIVNWKCHNCGHKWLASIINRTSGGTRCPNCRKDCS